MKLSSLPTKLIFIGCGDIPHISPLYGFAMEHNFQVAASLPPADKLFSEEIPEAIAMSVSAAAPQVAVMYCPNQTGDTAFYVRNAKKLAPQVLLLSSARLTREEAKALDAFGSVAVPVHRDERAFSDFRMQLVLLIRNARIAGCVASLGMKGTWSCFPQAVRSEMEQVRGGIGTIKAIAIGASAGGTEALSRLLPRFPKDFPCTLVVQHMPKDFTGLFAAGLDKKCAAEVREAVDGDVLAPGLVLIAPGDRHMTVERRGGDYFVRLSDGEKVSGHRPSVDALFSSAADALGGKAIGVILTGMGADGAEGLLRMKNAGARTIGQDAATSAVYGMPRAAYVKGAVMAQMPLDRIADELAKAIGTTAGRADES